MKTIATGVLALFLAAPLYGQGLTITLQETGPGGKTSPSMQIDKTHARLDVPSLLSQLIYDGDSKTLRHLIPLTRTYKEYTPASAQRAGAAPAQPAPAKVTYRKAGTGKVKDWTCTNYEGYRGSEKVVEVCAADGVGIGLSRADFTLVQQALDMMKTISTPEVLDRIPVFGNVESQGYVGFPVRRVSYRDGKADITTELVELKHDPVPAAAFALPTGFNKAP